MVICPWRQTLPSWPKIKTPSINIKVLSFLDGNPQPLYPVNTLKMYLGKMGWNKALLHGKDTMYLQGPDSQGEPSG